MSQYALQFFVLAGRSQEREVQGDLFIVVFASRLLYFSLSLNALYL